MSEFDSKEFLKSLTGKPGVYRMLDEKEVVIYVGKASNLKKRVSSYFTRTHDSAKTRVMVNQIEDIQVTVTQTEGEALLLENNLIKEYKPRYNILFRDDKSYPYLYLSTEHDYPRLSFYRGARKGKGKYFGPYPSAGPARQTLNLVQKLFQIRQCDDNFFRNRSRACLQYQIKRCTAPCVDYISTEDYAESVKHSVMFLKGKNDEVIKALTEPMHRAAEALEYERAATYRDQINSLRIISEKQYITNSNMDDLDIVAVCVRADMACIQVFFIRSGRNLGNKTYFPTHAKGASEEEIISAFLRQYYLSSRSDRMIPSEILLSHEPEDKEVLEQVFGANSKRRVILSSRLRGDRAKWRKMAANNADIALNQRISSRQNTQDRISSLQQILQLEEAIERIECFDISHTGGEATVASCVVYGSEGALKSDYRRFNIENIKNSDDYAAMAQAVERRYTRVQKEEGKLPDLILIDGGKGQLAVAKAVMNELQLSDILMIGVAKGPSRKPGMETLILSDMNKTLNLSPSSSALHLIREVRDEAHRFAITGHRQRRKKIQGKSPLEDVDGIGSKRRQQLIHHFGGMQGIERAGVEDLANVPGINKNLANKIYNSLHDT